MYISVSVSTVSLRHLRKQMSPFYFRFQFRNVEYSSGRNKTLLCFRVETPGGASEPLTGYMEDEHATAHAEDAFFQQVGSTCSTAPPPHTCACVGMGPCYTQVTCVSGHRIPMTS